MPRLGAVAFLLAMVGFVMYWLRTIAAYRQSLAPWFPTPPADEPGSRAP